MGHKKVPLHFNGPVCKCVHLVAVKSVFAAVFVWFVNLSLSSLVWLLMAVDLMSRMRWSGCWLDHDSI